MVAMMLLACGGSEPPPVAAPAPQPSAAPPPPVASAPVDAGSGAAPPETVAVDTPRTTVAGTTYIVPAGWTVDATDARVILQGPEPDLRVALVDGTGTNGDDVVAAAWKIFHPGFSRPLKLVTPSPGRDGWDEMRRYEYETSANEELVVYVTARRHGGMWSAKLIECKNGSFQKRLAPLSVIANSLHPRGYAKESFAGKTAHELDAARIKQITDVLDRARDVAGVPGVAISLFTTDKVLFQGGFGVRELGKPAKVDADTLFMIASNTKALTTLLLAEMVDDGKFGWDTPVTQVYPAFKLGDAATTAKVLVKHLVCACTGLPRQDLDWLFNFKTATPATEMTLLGTFQPTTGFGETYQYSNLLAAAAGFVAAHAYDPSKELGAAYDEAMARRVFGPLGMSETTFDYRRALKGDHASPHGDDFQGHPAVSSMDLNYSIVPLRPAGGAWSSVKDLTRYAQMELAKGLLPSGKRLVSEKNLLARRERQVAEDQYEDYGMGLEVNREFGVPVVHHGGSMLGFKSDMVWLPEQGVGGVILTNSDTGGLLLYPFQRRLLEVLFDGRPEAEEDLAASAKRYHATTATENARRTVPPDAQIFAKLAPHYASTALGDLRVVTKGDKHLFEFAGWKSAVGTRKNDDGTVSIVTVDPSVDDMEFVVAEREGKRVLLLHDAQHEYSFVEAP
jgi:CubicO group peptidase (beta-lactamase class C family)